MRTRDQDRQRGAEPLPAPRPSTLTGRGAQGTPRPNVATQSDIITPFLSTGGWGFFNEEDNGGPIVFNPRLKGAQLVTSVYIPAGRVGFLKQVRVGPRKPSFLADVWNAGGIHGPYTTPGPDPQEISNVAWQVGHGNGGGTNEVIWSGIWTEPMGWEAYRDQEQTGSTITPIARWSWQLTLMRGTLDALRRSNNIPAFSFFDPASWYCVDNIPVPFGDPTSGGFENAYPAGIPGSPAGVQFGPQRMQAIPTDPLNLHLLIPEDSTLCLFTTWEQLASRFYFEHLLNTNTVTTEGIIDDGVVVGPSYGSLLGYTQPVASQAGVNNALGGWGG